MTNDIGRIESSIQEKMKKIKLLCLKRNDAHAAFTRSVDALGITKVIKAIEIAIEVHNWDEQTIVKAKTLVEDFKKWDLLEKELMKVASAVTTLSD